MPGISYTSAFLIGAFLECVMYGIFVPLYIAACYVQWEKFSRGQGVNRLMASATVFFGLTVTTNLGISLYVAIRAILDNPPGTTIYLSQEMQYSTRWLAWFMIFQLEVTVGDIIIIYRMYHIYDKNTLICVIPSITTAAAFVTGCGLVHQFLHPTAPSFLKEVGYWTLCAFCLTIFNTLSLTIGISSRLWRVHRGTVRAGLQTEDSIILRAIRALIESAALWATFTLINFFATIAQSNIAHTTLAMTSPAVGISFCLIIVRLGRILPEARDETWHTSIRTPAFRTPTADQVSISFPKVKIQREVYVSKSGDLPMGILGPRKEGYVDSSNDSPKISRSSLSLVDPASCDRTRNVVCNVTSS